MADFETGSLSQWQNNQSCPDGVQVVTNPVRGGKYAAKLTVSDSSTKSNCPKVPTDNPRAQLVSDPLFREGDEFYVGFSTLFPNGFPVITDWFQVAELYGEPWGGSPTMGIDVKRKRMVLARDQAYGWDDAWTAPVDIQTNAWIDIVMRVKFSTNPSVGFVEIWYNGQPQTMKNGSKRIYYETLRTGVNWNGSSPNRVFMNQYRSSNTPLGTVTIYHDEVRVGRSYEAVAP